MKIADFGLARDIKRNDYYRKHTRVSWVVMVVLLILLILTLRRFAISELYKIGCCSSTTYRTNPLHFFGALRPFKLCIPFQTFRSVLVFINLWSKIGTTIFFPNQYLDQNLPRAPMFRIRFLQVHVFFPCRFYKSLHYMLKNFIIYPACPRNLLHTFCSFSLFILFLLLKCKLFGCSLFGSFRNKPKQKKRQGFYLRCCLPD